MPRPRMIVVAGPPGSGKTRYFPVTAFGIDAFNIDDRCAQILGSYRAIPRDVRRAVAKECERFVLDRIPWEVLRGRDDAPNDGRDRAGGARAQERLRHRDALRRHGLNRREPRTGPPARASRRTRCVRAPIRAIHEASVTNLRTAVATFNRVRIYDSTSRWAPPRLVAVARGGRLARQGATPTWLEGALAGSNE